MGEEINSFTPVQHPANDTQTDIITTHFNYHSIDHNLLKLDILGHDDPTMIKTLEEYISSPAMDNEYNETDHKFVATDIPLDDQDVMALFHGTEVLGNQAGRYWRMYGRMSGNPELVRILLFRWLWIQNRKPCQI